MYPNTKLKLKRYSLSPTLSIPASAAISVRFQPCREAVRVIQRPQRTSTILRESHHLNPREECHARDGLRRAEHPAGVLSGFGEFLRQTCSTRTCLVLWSGSPDMTVADLLKALRAMCSHFLNFCESTGMIAPLYATPALMIHFDLSRLRISSSFWLG